MVTLDTHRSVHCAVRYEASESFSAHRLPCRLFTVWCMSSGICKYVEFILLCSNDHREDIDDDERMFLNATIENRSVSIPSVEEIKWQGRDSVLEWCLTTYNKRRMLLHPIVVRVVN